MIIANIIHVTSLKGYNGIIKSGRLFNQSSLFDKGIIIKGEGNGINRRIGDRMATLNDVDWHKKYDEGRIQNRNLSASYKEPV